MITLTSKSWVFASVLYLALPLVLWLAGWVRPCFSIPLIALTGTGLCFIYRKLPSHQISLPRLPFLASLLIVSFITVLIGFTGHFEQHGDFFLRNPTYSDLIRYDWPLVFPDGNLFVYYFGFWLPPALVSKFLPQGWSPYILCLWSMAGMALFTGTMVLHFKKRILIFTMVLFALSSVTLTLAWGAELAGIMNFPFSVSKLLKYILWDNSLTSLRGAFNHIIPCLVFGAIFINKTLDGFDILLISSFLLISSPLGGLAFLPYLVYYLYQCRKELFSPSRLQNMQSLLTVTTACLLVLSIGLFLSGTGAEGVRSMDITLLFQKRPQVFSLRILLALAAFLILNLGIPASLLYPVFRKSALFWLTMCGLPVYSIIYIGNSFNELMLKSSGIFFLFLSILCCQGLYVMKGKRRVLLIAYLAFCGIYSLKLIGGQLKTFTATPAAMQQNINKEWEDTLYHPEHTSYWLLAKKPSQMESVLYYSRSGESAEGIMGWAATGNHADEVGQYFQKREGSPETAAPQDK